MATINWAFLCDYAVIDISGKISILGIFEHIRSPHVPIRWNQLFLATQFDLGLNANVHTAAVLSDPSGNEIVRTVGGYSTTSGDYPYSFVTYSFYAIDLKEFGEYRVELFVEGISVHSIPFQVIFAPPNA